MNKQIVVVLVNLILLTGCSGTMSKLGINNSELAACPETPNCVSSQAHDEKHYIEPINYSGTRQGAHDSLLRIIESEKRTEILTNQENYIRVEFTSALFRFVDDVEFYLSEEQDDERVIHVRSASRVGHSDLGANRKRIERIRSRFYK